jgi:AcrR family transcriptional regulator
MTDQSVSIRFPTASAVTTTTLHDAARRRAPDERPQQIIDAALAVFDERGLAGARLDDIAQRAGIAKGTIYLYFENKEELFREVIRHTLIDRLDAARSELAAMGEAVSATEQLRRYAEGWWAFLLTPGYQAVYRLVIGELHRFPDVAAFYAQEVVSRAHALVGSIIERGVARDEFRPIEPAVASRMITAAFSTHALWVCKQQFFKFPAASLLSPDEVRDQVVDFILRALRPDTPAAGASASHA